MIGRSAQPNAESAMISPDTLGIAYTILLAVCVIVPPRN
jgi:hypothetical protein